MTTPGKKYYKLNEQTGKHWPRTTEDDVLAWCIAGHFPLYVYWEGVYGARGSLSKDGKEQVSEDGLTEAEFFHDGLYAELPTPVIERMLYENENPVRDTLFLSPANIWTTTAGIGKTGNLSIGNTLSISISY